MKIYTKTGDSGTTSLIGGERVPKNDIRVETYGTIDELNAWVGVLASMESTGAHHSYLTLIQRDLFTVGGHFAIGDEAMRQRIPRISSAEIEALERAIDTVSAQLPPLHNFVVAGGCLASGYASVARTVCRRAERCAVAMPDAGEHDFELRYLNRLSDYLFVFSRLLNVEADVPEKFL